MRVLLMFNMTSLSRLIFFDGWYIVSIVVDAKVAEGMAAGAIANHCAPHKEAPALGMG
jgi:hypothetical protein